MSFILEGRTSKAKFFIAITLDPLKLNWSQLRSEHCGNHFTILIHSAGSDPHIPIKTYFRIQSGDSTLPPKSESNPKPKNQQAFFCCYFCTSGPFVNRDLLISHLRNDHSIINNYSNIFSTCYFKSSLCEHSRDENVS